MSDSMKEINTARIMETVPDPNLVSWVNSDEGKAMRSQYLNLGEVRAVMHPQSFGDGLSADLDFDWCPDVEYDGTDICSVKADRRRGVRVMAVSAGLQTRARVGITRTILDKGMRLLPGFKDNAPAPEGWGTTGFTPVYTRMNETISIQAGSDMSMGRVAKYYPRKGSIVGDPPTLREAWRAVARSGNPAWLSTSLLNEESAYETTPGVRVGDRAPYVVTIDEAILELTSAYSSSGLEELMANNVEYCQQSSNGYPVMGNMSDHQPDLSIPLARDIVMQLYAVAAEQLDKASSVRNSEGNEGALRRWRAARQGVGGWYEDQWANTAHMIVCRGKTKSEPTPVSKIKTCAARFYNVVPRHMVLVMQRVTQANDGRTFHLGQPVRWEPFPKEWSDKDRSGEYAQADEELRGTVLDEDAWEDYAMRQGSSVTTCLGHTFTRGGAQTLVDQMDVVLNDSAVKSRCFDSPPSGGGGLEGLGVSYVHCGDDTLYALRMEIDGLVVVVRFSLDCSAYDLTQHADATQAVHYAYAALLSTYMPAAGALWERYMRRRMVALTGRLLVDMHHAGPSGMPYQSKVNDSLMSIVCERIEKAIRLTYAQEGPHAFQEGLKKPDWLEPIISDIGGDLHLQIRLENYNSQNVDSLLEAFKITPFLFMGYYMWYDLDSEEVVPFIDLPRAMASSMWPTAKYDLDSSYISGVERMRLASTFLSWGVPPPHLDPAIAALKVAAYTAHVDFKKMAMTNPKMKAALGRIEADCESSIGENKFAPYAALIRLEAHHGKMDGLFEALKRNPRALFSSGDDWGKDIGMADVPPIPRADGLDLVDQVLAMSPADMLEMLSGDGSPELRKALLARLSKANATAGVSKKVVAAVNAGMDANAAAAAGTFIALDGSASLSVPGTSFVVQPKPSLLRAARFKSTGVQAPKGDQVGRTTQKRTDAEKALLDQRLEQAQIMKAAHQSRGQQAAGFKIGDVESEATEYSSSATYSVSSASVQPWETKSENSRDSRPSTILSAEEERANFIRETMDFLDEMDGMMEGE